MALPVGSGRNFINGVSVQSFSKWKSCEKKGWNYHTSFSLVDKAGQNFVCLFACLFVCLVVRFLKMRGKRRRGFSPEIYVGCHLVNKASTNETEVILLGYPRYPKLPNTGKWKNLMSLSFQIRVVFHRETTTKWRSLKYLVQFRTPSQVHTFGWACLAARKLPQFQQRLNNIS